MHVCHIIIKFYPNFQIRLYTGHLRKINSKLVDFYECMPEILVLRQPSDKIYDEISCSEEDLGDTVENLYSKLNDNYSIEVKFD